MMRFVSQVDRGSNFFHRTFWSKDHGQHIIYCVVLLLLMLPMLSSLGIFRNFFCPSSEYDYIIVGSGPAGCVLANRLTQDGKHTVLLLERGQPIRWLNKVPSLQLILSRYFSYNQRFLAKKTPKACLGMERKRCPLVVGNTAGGGSAINTMLYTRGNRQDFEEWVQETGDEGWGYDNVLPYFVSLENYSHPQDPNDPVWGTLGERTISRSGSWETPDEKSARVIKVANKLLNKHEKENGEVKNGFYMPMTTIKDGERHDSYEAFIKTIKKRKHFHFRSKAYVKRVIFEGKNAVGVEYDIGIWPFHKTCVARAKKEVLLSAGTFGSAQLLMLSGIGPEKILSEQKIPVLSDLPVGKNLQDHIYTCVDFITSMPKGRVMVEKEASTYSELSLDVVKWFLRKKGLMTLPSFLTMMGYINVTGGGPYPDVEYLMLPISLAGPPPSIALFIKHVLCIGDEVYFKTYSPRWGSDGFLIIPIIMKPYSRGSMAIQSTDPYAEPSIDMNYYGDPRDLETMTKGIEFLANMSKDPELKAKLWDVPYEGCEKHQMWSRDYMKCVASHSTLTIYHYVGTCKMGRGKEDPTAVVDPEFRVIGVNRLRVIDGSIMPTLTTGHPQSVCQVIGARGAGIILGKKTPALEYM